jgi:hypothetical protein
MAKRFNPKNERQMSRLVNAVQWSRKKQEAFRSHRLEAIKQFVGFHYTEDHSGAEDRVPINLMELAVSTYRRQLSARSPQVVVNALDNSLKPFSSDFALAINHLIKEIDLRRSIDDVVVDALFSFGIMKVGITDPSLGESLGFRHNAGQPFADPVDLDDWCHDMTVKRYEEVAFAGNRFRMRWEDFNESPVFKSGGTRPTMRTAFNEQGDERVSGLSTGGETGGDEEFKDIVEIWDLWLPHDRLVVSLAVDDSGNIVPKPVSIVDWEGPERGPYHHLGYNRVPNNVMPLAPVSIMMDLHLLANTLFNKMGRDAERQKTVGLYQAGHEADADRVRTAKSGEMVRTENPEAFKEVKYGGISGEQMLFFSNTRDLFVYLNGNIDSLAGLSPQAETYGQERMLSSAASQRILEMQDHTVTFVQGVVEDLADYLWYDPLIDLPLVKRVEGTSMELPIRFSPELREGDRLDYNLSISPFSMQHRSPGEKLQTINLVLKELVLPMQDQFMAQGVGIDPVALFDLIARYSDTPEIRDVLTGIPAKNAGGSPGKEMPRKSPNTTRTEIRRSIPGKSREGTSNILQSVLLGGGANKDQTATLDRPLSGREE